MSSSSVNTQVAALIEQNRLMYDEETAYHLREIQRLTRDNGTLRDRLATVSNSHHSAQPANGHANEIQDLKSEIADLKRQKAFSERQNNLMLAQPKGANGDQMIQSLQAEISRLRGDYDNVTERLMEASKQLDIAIQKIDTDEKNYLATTRQFQLENANLKKFMMTQTEKYNTLATQYNELYSKQANDAAGVAPPQPPVDLVPAIVASGHPSPANPQPARGGLFGNWFGRGRPPQDPAPPVQVPPVLGVSDDNDEAGVDVRADVNLTETMQDMARRGFTQQQFETMVTAMNQPQLRGLAERSGFPKFKRGNADQYNYMIQEYKEIMENIYKVNISAIHEDKKPQLYPSPPEGNMFHQDVANPPMYHVPHGGGPAAAGPIAGVVPQGGGVKSQIAAFQKHSTVPFVDPISLNNTVLKTTFKGTGWKISINETSEMTTFTSIITSAQYKPHVNRLAQEYNIDTNMPEAEIIRLLTNVYKLTKYIQSLQKDHSTFMTFVDQNNLGLRVQHNSQEKTAAALKNKKREEVLAICRLPDVLADFKTRV